MSFKDKKRTTVYISEELLDRAQIFFNIEETNLSRFISDTLRAYLRRKVGHDSK